MGNNEVPGMDICDFLESRGQNVSNIPTSATSITSRQFLSPTDAWQFVPTSGASSACGSLTTDSTTIDTPMSRNSSNVLDNVSLSDPINMMRLESQSSHADGFLRNEGLSYQTTVVEMYPRKHEADFLGVGASLHALPHEYPASAPTAMERLDSSSSIGSQELAMAHNTAMERTESNMSNASLRERAKEALSRQNKNAQRAPALQPKPLSAKAESHHAPTTKTKDGKQQIPKNNYQRPKHPKVHCNQCKEYPEGFRGEHELRRHIDAKHKGIVKKWVCQDPRPMGIQTNLVTLNPLDKCKHCNANKHYGAYYNAAAHLRRTHFKKKPPRRAPHTKHAGSHGDSNDERRGGKGGGDWPPMSELKCWMREIYVRTDDPNAFISDTSGDLNEVDGEALDGAAYVNQGANQAMGMYVDMYSDLHDLNNNAFFDAGVPPISSASFFEGPIAALPASYVGSPYGSSSTVTVTGVDAYADQIHWAEGSPAMNPMCVADGDHPELDFSMAFSSS